MRYQCAASGNVDPKQSDHGIAGEPIYRRSSSGIYYVGQDIVDLCTVPFSTAFPPTMVEVRATSHGCVAVSNTNEYATSDSCPKSPNTQVTYPSHYYLATQPNSQTPSQRLGRDETRSNAWTVSKGLSPNYYYYTLTLPTAQTLLKTKQVFQTAASTYPGGALTIALGFYWETQMAGIEMRKWMGGASAVRFYFLDTAPKYGYQNTASMPQGESSISLRTVSRATDRISMSILDAMYSKSSPPAVPGIQYYHDPSGVQRPVGEACNFFQNGDSKYWPWAYDTVSQCSEERMITKSVTQPLTAAAFMVKHYYIDGALKYWDSSSILNGYSAMTFPGDPQDNAALFYNNPWRADYQFEILPTANRIGQTVRYPAAFNPETSPNWYNTGLANGAAGFFQIPGIATVTSGTQQDAGKVRGATLWCNINPYFTSGAADLVADYNDRFTTDSFALLDIFNRSNASLSQCCAGHQDKGLAGADEDLNILRCGPDSQGTQCVCGEGWGGILCADPIPDWRNFDPSEARECPPWDICMNRGRCVVDPSGKGIGCICKPGWAGGGSYSDGARVADTFTDTNTEVNWADIYGYQLLQTCLGGNGTFTVSAEGADWFRAYPSLHQCMIWIGTVENDLLDRTQQCPHLSSTEHCPRYLVSASQYSNNLPHAAFMQPVWPYVCANNSYYRDPLTGDETFDGPVYGGFHCNLCPKCNWAHTVGVGDRNASLAPYHGRDSTAAECICVCNNLWSGETCDNATCPGSSTEPELGPCGEEAAFPRGQCVIPETEYVANPCPAASRRFPTWLGPFEKDGYFSFVYPKRNTSDPQWQGRCVCNDGWGGADGDCSVELCPHDPKHNGTACGPHGSCQTTPAACPPVARYAQYVLSPLKSVSYQLTGKVTGIAFADAFTTLQEYGIFGDRKCPGTPACQDTSNPDSYCAHNAFVARNPMSIGQTPIVQDPGVDVSEYGPLTCAVGQVPTDEDPCHYIPQEWATGSLRSYCTAATCICDDGWEKDGNGLCTLRACAKGENGLECSGLVRADNGQNVCNRDPVDPRCECWRGIAGPRGGNGNGAFDIVDNQHRWGETCSRNYTEVCRNPADGEVCGGSQFGGEGCYIDGCNNPTDDWSKCNQLVDRNGAPRCHCNPDNSTYGTFCNISVCGGFNVQKVCSANNTGQIKTGVCDPHTGNCTCWNSSTIDANNPTFAPGVPFIGQYCQTAVPECGGVGNVGTNPCSGVGKCVVGVGCECPVAYNGSYCENLLPCGGCNPEGGACYDGTCYCFRNFAGALCDEDRCTATGGNHSSVNVCECPAGSVQYPNHLDVGYEAPPAAGVAIDSLAKALQLNASGLTSAFRGCRKLCDPSPYVSSSVECGSYIKPDTSSTPLTRCRDIQAANYTGSPVCTCAGSPAADYRAPNPNVNQINTFDNPPTIVAVDWEATDGTSSTCRPYCAYCFQAKFLPGSQTCDKNRCDGMPSEALTEAHLFKYGADPSCQYTGDQCDTQQCGDSHGEHEWVGPPVNKCVCHPKWLYDTTGICTYSHTRCALTGGYPPDGYNTSGWSGHCVCPYPLTVDLGGNHSTNENYGVCVDDCGEYGTANTDTMTCDCISGGIISGSYCNVSACNSTNQGTADVAYDSKGRAVHASSCICPLRQWQGTLCSTNACLHGTPRTAPDTGCNCYFGWTGVLCDARSGVCGSHGVLTPSAGAGATCVCDPGWNGTSCAQNLCALGVAGIPDAHPLPVPCTQGIDCTYPNDDYNCNCGDGYYANFTNSTGLLTCVNHTHLDCGPNGQWGKFLHNNSYHCICNFGYSGYRCETHICGNSTESIRHRVAKVQVGDYVEYRCECDSPDFYDFEGGCRINCSHFEVVYPETTVRLQATDSLTECNCSQPGFVVDNRPPTWLNSAYNETPVNKLHCRRDCVLNHTLSFNDTTCVCDGSHTGEFCEIFVAELADVFDISSTADWVYGALVGGLAVAALLVFWWQTGRMPTFCYADKREQTRMQVQFDTSVSSEPQPRLRPRQPTRQDTSTETTQLLANT